MPATDNKALLKEIRAMAKVQQEVLEELRTKPHRFGVGKAYWKYLVVVAILTLAAGSIGAYEYYKVLQSIIDQFPH